MQSILRLGITNVGCLETRRHNQHVLAIKRETYSPERLLRLSKHNYSVRFDVQYNMLLLSIYDKILCIGIRNRRISR